MVQDKSLSAVIHQVMSLSRDLTQALVAVTVIMTSTTVITDTVSDRITITMQKTLQHCSNGR